MINDCFDEITLAELNSPWSPVSPPPWEDATDSEPDNGNEIHPEGKELMVKANPNVKQPIPMQPIVKDPPPPSKNRIVDPVFYSDPENLPFGVKQHKATNRVNMESAFKCPGETHQIAELDLLQEFATKFGRCMIVECSRDGRRDDDSCDDSLCVTDDVPPVSVKNAKEPGEK